MSICSNCRSNGTEGSTNLFTAASGPKAVRDAPKGQADLERILADRQVPKLVLQDDGHFLGILRARPLRQADAVCAGIEGHKEMVVAGQAVLGGVGEHRAQNSAQGFLDQEVVADMINGHETILAAILAAVLAAVPLLRLSAPRFADAADARYDPFK